MNRVFMSLIVAGISTNIFASQFDIDKENQKILLELKLNELKNNSTIRKVNFKSLSSFFNSKQRQFGFNSDENKVKEITGKFKLSYTIIDAFTDYLNIEDTSLDDTFGYIVTGKHSSFNSSWSSANLLYCLYDVKKLSKFSYVCLGATMFDDISKWFYFDINGDNISGKYYIGNSSESATARLNGSDYDMSGYRIENYGTTTTTTTSTSYSDNSSEFIYNQNDLNDAKDEQIEDCKKDPESCGIEIPTIDSSLKYTQSDLTSAKEESILECQKDPESCGIISLNGIDSMDSTTLKLSKEYIDTLPSGWNLIGTSSSLNDFSIFEELEIVWVYTNGSWVNYNPKSIMPPQITIDNFSGIWLKK